MQGAGAIIGLYGIAGVGILYIGKSVVLLYEVHVALVNGTT